MNEANPYAVIVDRISHEIPYYRTYLKNAVLQGTVVVNNPFWWSADDKFFGACLLDKLGIKPCQNCGAAFAFLHRRRGDRIAAQS